MRGASALGEALRDRTDIAVFVVWEPVLRRDRRPPSKRVREMMPATAQLFWDPDRSLSDAVVATAQTTGQPVPDDGIVWDVVFLYESGQQWEAGATFPMPDWWGAPVVAATEPLIEELRTP